MSAFASTCTTPACTHALVRTALARCGALLTGDAATPPDFVAAAVRGAALDSVATLATLCEGVADVAAPRAAPADLILAGAARCVLHAQSRCGALAVHDDVVIKRVPARDGDQEAVANCAANALLAARASDSYCRMTDTYVTRDGGWRVMRFERAAWGALLDCCMGGSSARGLLAWLPPPAAYSIVLRVLLALYTMLRTHGITHRDIHGGNILLAPCDAGVIEYTVAPPCGGRPHTLRVPTWGVRVMVADWGSACVWAHRDDRAPDWYDVLRLLYTSDERWCMSDEGFSGVTRIGGRDASNDLECMWQLAAAWLPLAQQGACCSRTLAAYRDTAWYADGVLTRVARLARASLWKSPPPAVYVMQIGTVERQCVPILLKNHG